MGVFIRVTNEMGGKNSEKRRKKKNKKNKK